MANDSVYLLRPLDDVFDTDGGARVRLVGAAADRRGTSTARIWRPGTGPGV